ncbi:stalk domain-containing protein [Fusibacter bizertensis]|uniref:Stalk domain-containing protein n=1 Tax=Fusibacter bizertensis TaxID=1488331 RepID=A0ABT6NDR1_9FIRM|nr:stalk domain-containing protein [Fusibacter bizertensis]MDH8678537.1 stalk domain-containing protein [Fusibacter bizertensis]
MMIYKKTLLLIIFLCITFFSVSALSFASPSMGEPLETGTIFLAEQTINFEINPFILNGEIMVSARGLCEKLGTQVFWFEKTGEVVSYRDNIFVKFVPNSQVAYVNGKPKNMSVSAMIYKGELFIPASFAAKTLEMNYSTSIETNTLSIDYRENLLEYQQIGLRHFKRINLANWGISFYVPEYWNKLEETSQSYGVEDPFETYHLEARIYPLTKQYSRAILTESILSDLRFQYDENVHISTNSTYKMGEYIADVLHYDITDEGVTTQYAVYIFFEQNNGYVLMGSYPSSNNQTESIEILDSIASTFAITKLSINENLEHYTELPIFYDLNMRLKSEIYSNMPIQNMFSFNGTIDIDQNIKGFHIIVSKDDNETEYYVPITDGEFATKIYTPFGLGKHNITVIADDTTENIIDENAAIPTENDEEEQADTQDPEIQDPDTPLPSLPSLEEMVAKAIMMNFDLDANKTVMKFSVLNTSSDEIKYLLPSEYVNYDNTTIYNISNSLTYNLTNQYTKSKALYTFIATHYALSETVNPEGLYNAVELTELKNANAIELCILYTSLLRSVDIPARISRGISEEGISYWVETYINGKWYISSIVDDIKQGDGTTSFFNLNRSAYYELFSTVEFLPF